MTELAGHRLIGFDRQTAYIRMMRKLYPLADEFAYAFRTSSHLAHYTAIRAGIGIGVCQTGLARPNPDLVHILADEFEIPLGTWVAMHESLKTSPRCRATFDALVNGLQDYYRYSTSA